MKRYTTAYYLLFVLIVMGAFASMAQNDYGMTILGFVAASFSAIFLIQLINVRSKKQPDKGEFIELVCLCVLTAIMAMRVFYIRFLFVEYVFALAGLVLVMVYMRKMFSVYNRVKADNRALSILVLIFYGSVTLYLISMIAVPFLPAVAEPIGIAAFVLMVLAAIGNWVIGSIIVNDEKTTSFQFAIRLKDRSMVLLSLFVLFSLYMAFIKVNLVPRLYSDEFPQSYFELVNRAETGKEIPVNGKFKHELFKQNYETFLKDNPVSE